MKSQKHLLHLLLAIICLSPFGMQVNAQEVEWSPEKKLSNKALLPDIIGENEKSIFTLIKRGGDLYVESTDKESLEENYSNVIEYFGPDADDLDFEYIAYSDNIFYLFASIYDRKTDLADLYVFTIDANTGSYISKKGKLLYSITVEKKKRKGNFRVLFSPNRQYMVAYHVAYYKKNKKIIEKFQLLDMELNTLTEKEEVNNESDELVSKLWSYLVDNEGSIYYIKGDKVGIYDANKDYENWSEKIEPKGMERGSSIVNNIISISPDGDFLITGMYERMDYNRSDKGSKKRRSDTRKGDKDIQGAYYYKINSLTKEVVASKISPLESSFFDKLKNAKDEKKDREVELNNNFSNFKIRFLEDGSCIYMAEQYEHRYVYDANDNVVGENFTFGGIVLFKFDTKGNLQWSDFVPKAQYCGFAYISLFVTGPHGISFGFAPYYFLNYYSYGVFTDDKYAYIVFNDNLKNKEVETATDKIKYMRKPQKSVPTVYKFNTETGRRAKADGLEFADLKVILLPNQTTQQGPKANSYIFGQKGKKYKIGKITF